MGVWVSMGILEMRFIMRRRGIFVAAALLGCAALNAQITLTHNGSTVNIDENNVRITNWVVDGADQVFENLWYYRDGDAGTASLVSTIGAPSVTLFGSQGAEVVYQNSDLTVTINYFLQANGDGSAANLSEQVTFATVLGINLRLFQYNDFDVSGSAGGDTATRLNSSTIDQTDMNFVETTGATPIPEFSEMGPFAALRTNITGTAGYNLNTAAGSGIGESQNGNMTFAYQWNRNLGAGDSFVMSTSKVAAIPEPATFAVLGLGALALLRRRRRK
ncbi:MAG: PEP-CTERM sorting domain-containing protein [Armatimonadetes bacterium]|nr:PEP-CTERM sorting domain-containing protein [Armatimonadota bacterium]